MLLFIKLVDYFQDDNDDDVKYSFITKLRSSCCETMKTESITQLIKNSIDISIDLNETKGQHKIIGDNFVTTPIHNSVAIYQRKCKEMTSNEVVKLAEHMVDGQMEEDVSFEKEIYSKNNRDILRGLVKKYSTPTPNKRKTIRRVEINTFCRQSIHTLLSWNKITGTLRYLLKNIISSSVLDEFISERGINYLFGMCKNINNYELSYHK